MHNVNTVRRFAVWVLAVAVTGCSAAYNGERLYWHASQLEKQITKDPGMATPAQYTNAIAAFERVINETPGTSWAAQAQFEVGSLYAVQKDYDRARAAYALVLQNFNRFQKMALNARMAVARTYEMQEDWAAVVKSYRDIASYHPYSQPGIEVPLRVGAVWEKHGAPEQATEAFEAAVRAYQKLIAESPSPEMTIQIKGLLAATYQKLEQWEQAASILEEVTMVPEGVNRPFVLLALASIYDNKLNDAARARQAYERMLAEFPTHPLAKAAQAQLDRLLKPSAPTGSAEAPAEVPAVSTPAAPEAAVPAAGAP